MHRLRSVFSMLNCTKSNLKKDYFRLVGDKEKFFLQVGDDQRMQFSGILFVSSKQPLMEANIRRSLLYLARRHPLLHACVVRENDRYYWKRMDTVKINFTVDDSIDWQQALSNSLDYRYDLESGPLWRMIHFPNVVSEVADHSLPYHSAFLLNTNHAILDGQGKGQQHFYKDLRDALSRCDSKPITDGEETCLDVPPALQHYTLKDMPTRLKLIYVMGHLPPLSNIVRHVVNARLHRTDPCEYIYRSTPVPNDVSLQTKLIPVVIGEKDLDVISRACKMEQVGVHAAMQAACKQAMKEIIQEKAAKLNIAHDKIPTAPVKTAMARPHFDNRKYENLKESYVKTSAWHLADYIDMSKKPTDFWSSAKYEKQFMKSKHKESEIKSYFRNKFVDANLLSSLSKESRTHLLSFSNLGRIKMLDNAPNAEIRFTGQFNAVAEHFRGPAISNTSITFDNKLCWSVMYFPPVTDEELAQKYINRSLDILMHECAL